MGTSTQENLKFGGQKASLENPSDGRAVTMRKSMGHSLRSIELILEMPAVWTLVDEKPHHAACSFSQLRVCIPKNSRIVVKAKSSCQ